MVNPVSSSVSCSPVQNDMKAAYDLLCNPVDWTQVQHILDHIKRLSSLSVQLKALLGDQALHPVRDGTGHTTILLIMEERFFDDFRVIRYARVIYIGQIAARAVYSASISLQVD